MAKEAWNTGIVVGFGTEADIEVDSDIGGSIGIEAGFDFDTVVLIGIASGLDMRSLIGIGRTRTPGQYW